MKNRASPCRKNQPLFYGVLKPRKIAFAGVPFCHQLPSIVALTVLLTNPENPSPTPIGADNHAAPRPAEEQPPTTPSAGELYIQAQRYLDAEDFAKALPLLQRAADAGDSLAMFGLGQVYQFGEGVEKDPGKAHEWFQKALPLLQKTADAGNASAMLKLGYLYNYGSGVAKDSGKAFEWFQKAANAGDPDGMFNLAVMYALGDGIAKDFSKAFEWFQKAADAGNTFAMQSLALEYWRRATYGGENDPEDNYGKARVWFQKAADAGDSLSMFNLGAMYERGQGVAKDYSRAREWYQKAADAGSTAAKEKLMSLPSR